MVTLLFLCLQAAPEETIYERLKKQNPFATKIVPPPPPITVKPPKEEEDPPPPPPQPSAFDIAGIVLNTVTQAYEVLIVDRDESDGTYLKAGDTLHGATVAGVEKFTVKIVIGEKTQELNVGENYELLVKGRSGSGRTRPRSSDPTPSTSGPPAATTGGSGRTGGLLDSFRKRRTGGGDTPTTTTPTPETPATVADDNQGGLVDKWKKWKEANP